MYVCIYVCMYVCINVLNGDFPARLWLTAILTNLNWNMGAGLILVLHKMLTFSRTPGLILWFRGSKSSSNFGNSFFIVWWHWKLGQGHQNLTNSFHYPTDTINIHPRYFKTPKRSRNFAYRWIFALRCVRRIQNTRMASVDKTYFGLKFLGNMTHYFLYTVHHSTQHHVTMCNREYIVAMGTPVKCN